jgi:hypothetical protein
MKYFTPRMWPGFNGPHPKAALGTWDRRFEAYQANLKSILPSLNPGTLQKHQQSLQRLVPQPRLVLSLLAKLAPLAIQLIDAETVDPSRRFRLCQR